MEEIIKELKADLIGWEAIPSCFNEYMNSKGWNTTDLYNMPQVYENEQIHYSRFIDGKVA